MTSNKVLFGQIGYVLISTVAFVFKIYYVTQDAEMGGTDKNIRNVDIIFSVLLTIFTFIVIAAYSVLFHKFLVLIKNSNGFLDFMKSQIMFFFSFLIVLISLKTISIIMIPI